MTRPDRCLAASSHVVEPVLGQTWRKRRGFALGGTFAQRNEHRPVRSAGDALLAAAARGIPRHSRDARLGPLVREADEIVRILASDRKNTRTEVTMSETERRGASPYSLFCILLFVTRSRHCATWCNTWLPPTPTTLGKNRPSHRLHPRRGVRAREAARNLQRPANPGQKQAHRRRADALVRGRPAPRRRQGPRRRPRLHRRPGPRHADHRHRQPHHASPSARARSAASSTWSASRSTAAGPSTPPAGNPSTASRPSSPT